MQPVASRWLKLTQEKSPVWSIPRVCTAPTCSFLSGLLDCCAWLAREIPLGALGQVFSSALHLLLHLLGSSCCLHHERWLQSKFSSIQAIRCFNHWNTHGDKLPIIPLLGGDATRCNTYLTVLFSYRNLSFSRCAQIRSPQKALQLVQKSFDMPFLGHSHILRAARQAQTRVVLSEVPTMPAMPTVLLENTIGGPATNQYAF